MTTLVHYRARIHGCGPARLQWALRTAALSLAVALQGCGGGGGGGGGGSGETAPPPSPPPANTAPSGAFSAAASVDALAPLALDASASTDADGDILTYHWDFGDGLVGGGVKIAHLYTAAGSYSVRLTVDDGRGGVHAVTRSVSVNAPPAPLAVVNTQVIVRTLDGALLSGVSVKAVDGEAAAVLTDAQGRAAAPVGTGVAQLLKFSKAGYADQFRDARLPGSAEGGYLEVTMLAREPALTLADAAAGGTLTGKDGASVTFEPGALVDAIGQPVSGPVSVAMTPVDIARNVQAFPGRFAGVRTDGRQGLLLSYGTVEYALSAGGQRVQLAPGRKARIDIPVYASIHADGSAMQVGDTSPLWSLDERTGAWTEEGSGVVVAANTPSGFALRAQVQHFSWWNHDDYNDPPARPKPKCMVDTNADGILEDLTGTGHCWHAGTGPEQPSNSAQAKPAAPGAAARAGNARALADLATQRIPAYAAWASTPAAGGVELAIPANMDITFRSYAMNGNLFGTRVVNMAANVSEEVQILLKPVQGNPGTLSITLPHTNLYRMDVSAEVDRFTFAGEAGASYEVTVSAGGGSQLTGAVRVLAAAGTQLNGGTFTPQTAFLGTASSTSAGTMTIEVQASAQAPGTYVLEVRRLTSTSNCTTPQALALPGTAANFSVPGNGGLRCFNLSLTADDVLEIKNTQNLNAEGAITLVSPSGVQVARDTYGSGPLDAMLLRAAIAEAGTWRLEITNTRTTQGTISGLSTVRLPVAGVLGVPDSASFATPATADNSRYYVIKPSAPRANLALTLDSKGINQGVRVEPLGLDFGDASPQVRIVPTVPGLNLLVNAFRRSNSTAWDLTLTTGEWSAPALDSDLTINATGAGIAAVYGLTGGGTSVSLGRRSTNATRPALELYAPLTGVRISTTEGGVYPLNQAGLYTLVVRNGTASAGPMTVRINTAAEPEAVTLATPLQRSFVQQLGEVRRYTFNATQGQVLALGLSTPVVLDLQAQLGGGSVFTGFATLNGGPAPRLLHGGPRYVQQAGPMTLSVFSPSSTDANLGSATVTLQSPPPLPSSLGALIDTTLVPGTLATYAYNLPAAGAHMLCTSHNGGGGGVGVGPALNATVWGPSAPFSNYTGDLTGTTTATRTEDIGNLRAGANTLSLMMGLTSSVQAQVRLTALPPINLLTLGAAPLPAALTPCSRGVHLFDGVGGQAYTVRVAAGFGGQLRVRKQPPNGDPYVRTDPPFGTLNLGGTPLPLTANVERVLSFSIPTTSGFGSGVYVVEVDDDADAGGAYTVRLNTP